MSRGSLRLRLLIAAAISIAIALGLTSAALVRLFERQVRERVISDLDNDLLQLIGTLETGSGQVAATRSLSDPRYQQPYGGRYWRIDFSPPGIPSPLLPLRSESLWDGDINRIGAPAGPEGEPLIIATREVTIQMNGRPLPLWLLAAAQAEEVSIPLAELRDQLTLAFLFIGCILTLAAWVQVAVGLRPLEQLRRQLADVRAGLVQKLRGDVPSEVAPLVEEFNDVLDLRERSLERARRRAGDLAHGLKTPLTVLAALAREVRGQKLEGPASAIEEQAEAMKLHVEQALARARLSTGRGHAATMLEPAVRKVMAALVLLPKGETIDWQVEIAAGRAVPIEQGDLTELLGNLLDNARKWAKARVRIRYSGLELTVEDDGPGVPDDQLHQIGQRGTRLDESTQGTGLGLSIVADIADIYNLAVSYGRSELGGLQVTIRV